MHLSIRVLVCVMYVCCDTNSFDWDCFPETAKTIVNKLGWREAAIIYDRDSIAILQQILRVRFLAYQINVNTTFNSILCEIHSTMFPNVNVILSLKDPNLITKVIYEADGLDIKNNHSTDWSHHSKWLVFSTEVSAVHLRSTHLQNLQHIATLSQHLGQCANGIKIFSLTSDVGGFKFNPMDEKGNIVQGMFPNTRYRYNGRPLRVSTLEAPPLVIANPMGRNEVPFTGYCIEVLHTIADHLNLTLLYVPARDGIWGWIDNGMMGQLQQGELDLIASDMIVNAKRAQHTDYIIPYLYTDELVLLYKMPPATQSILLLAGPFQSLVYITYSAIMFAVLAMFVLIETSSPRDKRTKRKRVSFLCWSVIKASLKQGDSYEDLTVPGRIILASWILLAMLFSALYCGNLTASLAASTSRMKFKSISDMLDSDFSAGFIPGSIVEQELKSSRIDDVKRLHQKIRHFAVTDLNVISSSLEYHMQRVRKGSYAYIAYSKNIDTISQNECNLSRLFFNDIEQEAVSFVVQKNSPFKQDINEVMQRLRSTGVLNKMWRKWTKKTTTRECLGDSHTVSILDLIGAAGAACIGTVIASVILLVEELHTRFKRNPAFGGSSRNPAVRRW